MHKYKALTLNLLYMIAFLQHNFRSIADILAYKDPIRLRPKDIFYIYSINYEERNAIGFKGPDFIWGSCPINNSKKRNDQLSENASPDTVTGDKTFREYFST